MDWLTFIVEITKAVAWPASVVVAVLLIRKPLYDLLPFLKKFKYKEFEIEFSEKVRELRKETQELLVVDAQDAELIDSDRHRYKQLIEISPRAAIVEVWLQLETAMIENIRRHGLAEESSILHGHSRLGHVLLHEGIINKQQFDIFHELRNLRNRAAHAEDFELKTSDAENYVESALLLATHLCNA
jgi:hypothetical protein